MRRLFFLVPVLLFGALIGAFVVGLGRDPSILPSQLIDKPLPAFALPDVRDAGPGLTAADFRGEPRLLNVFASWCVACRVEHPMLLRLSKEGVPIDGLAWKDDRADSLAWLQRNGDPFARTGSDPTGRAGIDLGVTGAPETFVVDAQGRVRYRHVGPITEEAWAERLKPLFDRLRVEAG